MERVPGSKWRGLETNAKAALREISKKPDGYPRAELLAVLDTDGATLGGNMSSVGFGMNYFPKYEKPYVRENGAYRHEASGMVRQGASNLLRCFGASAQGVVGTATFLRVGRGDRDGKSPASVKGTLD